MHRYTSLREVFPGPRVVTLAGEQHLAAEFTLGDLAELDRWLAAPAEASDVPPGYADPDPGGRRSRLIAAWRSLEGIPSIGGPGSGSLLSSAEGRAVQVLLSCARAGREIAADRAAWLAAECSPAEWAAFDRIAWGVPAWKPIARELDPDFESWREDGSGEPHDWGLSLAKACEGDPTRLPAMANLTISQYRLLCRGGEPDWYRCVPKDGETTEQLMERSAAVFREEEPTGDEPGSIAPRPPEPDD